MLDPDHSIYEYVIKINNHEFTDEIRANLVQSRHKEARNVGKTERKDGDLD